MEGAEKGLEELNRALERSDYRGAISMAHELPRDQLGDDDLRRVVNTVLIAAAGLADDSDDELRAYDLILDLVRTMTPAGAATAVADARATAALFNKGVVLAHLGRDQEALAIYDDLVSRGSTSSEPDLKHNAAKALFNKAAHLGRTGRLGEAVATYDKLIGAFGSDPDANVAQVVGKSLVNKGIALAELDRLTQAIGVFDEVVIRYGDSREAALRLRAARALLNKASALIQLDKRNLALEAYEEVVKRYRRDKTPTLRDHVEIARTRKDALGQDLH